MRSCVLCVMTFRHIRMSVQLCTEIHLLLIKSSLKNSISVQPISFHIVVAYLLSLAWSTLLYLMHSGMTRKDPNAGFLKGKQSKKKVRKNAKAQSKYLNNNKNKPYKTSKIWEKIYALSTQT